MMKTLLQAVYDENTAAGNIIMTKTLQVSDQSQPDKQIANVVQISSTKLTQLVISH